MKTPILLILFIMLTTTSNQAQNWDKTFPQNPNVNVQKVSFKNRYNITVVADMYLPKNMDKTTPHAAIIVGHPFGGVKEQSGGLYAQELAHRGFVTLAFDLSYGGESGGTPSRIASPETYVEDFSAAVDFIGTQSFVDHQRIGAIGICGSGGFGISAAAIDPRIKAIATVSMYDMGRERRQGFEDKMTLQERRTYLDQIAEQRWKEAKGEPVRYLLGTPETIDSNAPTAAKEFYDYYRTPRGQHPNSTTAISFTSSAPLMNFFPFANIEMISPRPILFIAGQIANSLYFSEEAYQLALEPKELYIVKGAGHVDLYDNLSYIPFNKLTSFFTQYLEGSLFRRGSSIKEDHFTGDAWIEYLSQENNFDCSVYNVTFAPASRNHWHTHSVGQILLCTQGQGYYQERGKLAQKLFVGSVVNIPAGVEHWHGAAPNSSFSHVGITPKLSQNQAEWKRPLTDKEYQEATR